MIGEGWSIIAAAGDGGSTTDCRHLSVSHPASDPDVSAVGGTSLSMNQSYFGQEVTWSGGPWGCAYNDGGTGGGCSRYYSAPGYEEGTACSGQMRTVPDISLNSDGVYEPQNFYFEGYLQGTGGTSIAAPEMAGFFAQENAYLLYIQNIIGSTCGYSLSSPCAPMGAPNPYLFKEGLHPYTPHYPFYSITQGCNNNDITQQYGLYYYCANAGYDRATGWGSPNMLQLAWAINYMLAGDQGGTSVFLSGPPVHQWYNTDQSVTWNIADTTRNGHHAIGVAGASIGWDVDPGDAYNPTTPGAGNGYYGPQVSGAVGSGVLSLAGQGCHTAYVRAWDNAGNSGISAYGPLCYDTIPPQSGINLIGDYEYPGYVGPVQVNMGGYDGDNGSGIASTSYQINGSGWQTFTQPFYEVVPGGYELDVYSVDVAGNVGNTVSTYFTITSNTQFGITVAKPGTGQGTVTSTDGAINCGSTCSAPYYDEQPMTLTATPAAGSVFMGWRNCDQSSGFSCTLTVTAARTVTAVFNTPVALQFVPVTPCRVVDTRGPAGAVWWSVVAGRNFPRFRIAQRTVLRHSIHGRRLFAERYGGPTATLELPDSLADRLHPAGDFHPQLQGRSRQSQRGRLAGGR